MSVATRTGASLEAHLQQTIPVMARRVSIAIIMIGLVCGASCYGSSNIVKTKKISKFLGFNITTGTNYDTYVTNISIAEIPASGSSELNLNFTLVYTVPASDAFIQSTIYIKQPTGSAYVPLFVSKRYNACDLIKKSKQDRYLHSFIENLNRYTTFMQHCPFVPGDYVAEHITMDLTYVPMFLPSTIYILKLQFLHFAHNRYNVAVTFFLAIELKNAQ